MSRYYRYSTCVDAFQLGEDPFPHWFTEAMLDNQVAATIIGQKDGKNIIDVVVKYGDKSEYAPSGSFIAKIGKGIVAYPPRSFHLEFGKVQDGRLL